jgi:uncharacterized protein involved in exopolysaccharide biosynthesis
MSTSEDARHPAELSGAVRGYFVPVFETDAPRPVTFGELLRAVWLRWWWVVLGALAGLALGTAMAFLWRPVYQGKVLMVAVKDDAASGGLGSLVGQFGGLASLAGINLGSDSKRAENTAVLMSRGFTERFIRDENLMQILYAKRWDPERKAWKSHWWQHDPTMADAVRRFDSKIRSLTEERRSGVMTLIIEWKDRELAARWANDLVARANSDLRRVAIEEARRNIEFLDKQAAETSVAALRQAIYRVVETEVRREMLANVRPEYAFKVLDPAEVPDEREFVRPKRALLVAGGFMLGLCVGIGLAIGVALQRRAA